MDIRMKLNKNSNLLKKVKDKKLEIKTLMVKSQISSNIELKGKIKMKNYIHIRIKIKENQFSTNLIMMDVIFVLF